MGLRTERAANMRNLVTTRLSKSRLHILAAFAILFIFYLLTPYDSPVRSAFRFQHTIVADYIQHKYPSDKWLLGPPKYPIDPIQDVGVVIKTGYGTRRRVPNVLAAYFKEKFTSDMVIVQDYPVDHKQNYTLPNGKAVPNLDIIGWMLENKMLAGKETFERISKYKHLAEAIEGEELFLSEELSKNIGWELDAMKFISGLQYAWQTMPKKKWYLMVDDDTYVLKESLNLLLGHVNYAKPHYLGNAVGDYKGRFAHGGSSAIISGAAMKKLFEDHPQVAVEAHLESPTAIYGDKLLSTTLMKLGIYLDEAYNRLFNGEEPHSTRIWGDRFCVPLVSFHGLGSGDSMEKVGNTFKKIKDPVFWRQLAKIYGAAEWDTFLKEPIRVSQNFVGRLDEHTTTIKNTNTVEDCLHHCLSRGGECLAWTWDQGRKECYVAPWTIIGHFQDGVFSGVNGPVATKLASHCHSPPAPGKGSKATA
ncbi:glycosyltransferase family 31 [Apiospora rasikravindrae]|uniref:N-acetylgalactosaminide beta-1,3-galactosyltransferase n=1 Tax=Apiospora rasikravindrae TaxID=990691 RepID=A0ABR1TFU3_9PEZI